jgi:hypothetical protein
VAVAEVDEMAAEEAEVVASDKAILLFQFKDIQYLLEAAEEAVDLRVQVLKAEALQFFQLQLLAEVLVAEALEATVEVVDLAVAVLSLVDQVELVLTEETVEVAHLMMLAVAAAELTVLMAVMLRIQAQLETLQEDLV